MANCFFIDFENVHNSGLTNLKNLTQNDLLYIFYTTNTDCITLDTISQLKRLGCEYDFIKVPAGPQSLDKHLISFLGYAIGNRGKNYNYVIISKDKGYDNVISFWKSSYGIVIRRQLSINVNTTATNTTAKTSESAAVAKKSASPVTSATSPSPAVAKNSEHSETSGISANSSNTSETPVVATTIKPDSNPDKQTGSNTKVSEKISAQPSETETEAKIPAKNTKSLQTENAHQVSPYDKLEDDLEKILQNDKYSQSEIESIKKLFLTESSKNKNFFQFITISEMFLSPIV